MKSLPKLVIFGDPKKEGVHEAIDEFTGFAKDKAEIVASCNIEDCRAEILKECDFAIVFGGDGSIISAARNLSQASVPVIGVNLGKLGFPPAEMPPPQRPLLLPVGRSIALRSCYHQAM